MTDRKTNRPPNDRQTGRPTNKQMVIEMLHFQIDQQQHLHRQLSMLIIQSSTSIVHTQNKTAGPKIFNAISRYFKNPDKVVGKAEVIALKVSGSGWIFSWSVDDGIEPPPPPPPHHTFSEALRPRVKQSLYLLAALRRVLYTHRQRGGGGRERDIV